VDETMKMLDVYADFAENWMAMPVIQGEKTAGERFPGAVQTYCIEAMMQDRKALQAGTSHFLGQNFAKASGIKFSTRRACSSHAGPRRWGVSTRLVGGMIMTHADDDGMVCPPAGAQHAVILPVTRKPEERQRVLDWCKTLAAELRSVSYAGHAGPGRDRRPRDLRGGDKVWQWIKKGAPLRLEIGPRDIDSRTRCSWADAIRGRQPRPAGVAHDLLATIACPAAGDPGRLYPARAGPPRPSTPA
jgi:prolyl-tRNA synthetase